MGKQRRKFEAGFKQLIISEIESGLLSVTAASRKYQLSGSVIDRWRRQARQSALEAAPSVVKRLWNVRTASSRRNWLSCIWKTPS